MLSDRFCEALTFASQLHRSQKRKGSQVPYVSHLLSVAGLVLEDGGTEDEAIAALLHDAVEDQGGLRTREKILEKFGSNVTAIIDGCTDSDSKPKPSWEDRKARYLKQIRQGNDSVFRVSLADKLHNLRSLKVDLQRHGEEVWLRFERPKEKQIWFYREYLSAAATWSDHWMYREIEGILDILE